MVYFVVGRESKYNFSEGAQAAMLNILVCCDEFAAAAAPAQRSRAQADDSGHRSFPVNMAFLGQVRRTGAELSEGVLLPVGARSCRDRKRKYLNGAVRQE